MLHTSTLIFTFHDVTFKITNISKFNNDFKNPVKKFKNESMYSIITL